MCFNRTIAIIGVVVVAALIGLRCSGGQVAGTITQSGNGIVSGSVVDGDEPVAGARVLLIPVQHDPVTDASLAGSLIDTTGPAGDFLIFAPVQDDYNVMVEHQSGKNALSYGVSFVTSDTQDAGRLSLTDPGFVAVIIHDTAVAGSAYVYIPGTTIFTPVQGDTVLLENIPAGVIPQVRFHPGDTAGTDHTVCEDISVSSGDTTLVNDYSPWSFSATIHLNTTASGADVPGEVVDFPLLIRLSSDNFDFSRAENNGIDIRFTKRDGSSLPYEVERWDAAAQRAEIWVKVDTIRGNDSTQSIVMYWGNSDASEGSDGAAVFDTASGFAGVWHLSENGTTVDDATANGIDGVAKETVTVTGAIGTAQEFDGTSSFVRASGPATDALNFSEDDDYSVSAWIRTDALDTLFHGIVYKSNFQYGLQMRPEKVWEFLTYTDGASWEMSRASVEDTAWHYLVGVRNGAEQYLYVDGVRIDSAMVTIETNAVRDYSQPLEIGHCPDGGEDPDRYFDGSIDEVRIAKVATGADWVKLCYMNQKDRDVLVKW